MVVSEKTQREISPKKPHRETKGEIKSSAKPDIKEELFLSGQKFTPEDIVDRFETYINEIRNPGKNINKLYKEWTQNKFSDELIKSAWDKYISKRHY